MTTPGRFIGIDVAKRQLDVAERPSGARWSGANDIAGIGGLVERLRAGGPGALVVLEATGGYEMPLVAALTAAHLPVVVVNPRQVRDFARAVGTLAKTDAIDAGVWAHFGEAVRPEPRAVPDDLTQELQGGWPAGGRCWRCCWRRSSAWPGRRGRFGPRFGSTWTGCVVSSGMGMGSCRG